MNAPNDRDPALERLLRASLKTPDTGATASCLDPEMLAAWAEGGLAGDELDAAQSHVAGCARCQASLAALVHSSSFDSIRTVSEAPEGSRRWFAWIVPLTAAAAALAIWVAVPRGPATPTPENAAVQNQPAQLKAREASAPAAAFEQPSAKKEEQPLAANANRPQRDQLQAPGLSKDTGGRELDAVKQQAQSVDVAGDRADAARVSAEPASPAAGPAAAAPQAAAAETRQAFQETSANAVAQKTAPAARAAGSIAGVRWRLSGTTLERSADAGSTWSAVATGVEAEVTALSSPSPAVCWVVGTRGVVLRTTDGQSFSRVAFPETTDLSGVQAIDAQSATVTTRDGRRLTTTDVGATWRIAP